MSPPFPLAAVLALRQRKEEQEETTLRRLEGERCQLEANLETIQQELRKWTEDGSQAGHATGCAADYQQRHARIRLLLELQQQLLARMQANLEARSRQHEVYFLARKDRQVLTELRTSQVQAWKAAEQRREQQAMDAFAISLRFQKGNSKDGASGRKN